MSRWLTIAIALAACEGGKGGGLPPIDAAGSGIECGGLTGVQCPADELCDFPRDTCGAGDETGTCRARPTGACPEIFQPTCGCDGITYSSACEATAAGVDFNAFGNCPAPAGLFSCGSAFCSLADSYCRRTGSDTGGPDGIECAELPGSCGSSPTCDCVADDPCSDRCDDTGEGLEVTCLGG